MESEGTLVIFLDPVAKPRQTQSDKWKKRDSVVRYRNFADNLRFGCMQKKYVPSNPLSIEFRIAMPKSWSKKKKDKYRGQPHQQKPDLDNLIKAFKDALLIDDSGIHTYGQMKKTWDDQGQIWVELTREQRAELK